MISFGALKIEYNFYKNSIYKLLLKLIRRVFAIQILLLLNAYLFAQNNVFVADSLYITDTLHVIDTIMVSDTLKDDGLSENAIETPVDYLAVDSIEFSVSEKKVYLFGQAQINYGEIELKASYIEFDLSNNIVFAKGIIDSTGKEIGRPEFKEGDESFTAKRIRYNFDTKKGIIEGVFSEQSDGYLHSGKTKKMPNDQICLQKGKYTTCDLEHPHFYVALSKAKVIPNDKIISGPANIVIADIPLPIFIPFGYFPNKKGRASGILIPQYGEEENRGFFLRDGGYYLGINDKVDLTLKGEIYSKGSWGLSTISRYRKRYKYNGNFNFNYSNLILNEFGEPDYSKTKQYKLVWRHTQDPKARPNSNFSANVNFGSVSYDKYLSRNTNEYLNNTIQSSIAYRKTFPNTPFNMSATINHSQNSSDSTVSITLPNLSVNMNRIYPLKKLINSNKFKFAKNLSLSYNSRFENKITNIRDSILFTSMVFDEFKNGIQHSIPISTSMNVFKFFSINPSFNYTERWYFESIDKYWDASTFFDPVDSSYYYGREIVDTISGFNRVSDYSVSASVSTNLYGFYQFQASPIKLIRNSGLLAIRHKVSPSVSFRMRPDFKEEKWGYYDNYVNASGDTIDYNHYETGIYGVPSGGKSGMLSFRLNNNIEMKVRNRKDTTGEGTKKIPLLRSLNLGSSYNIYADSLNWSPVSVSGNTDILKMVNMNFGASLDPYAFDTIDTKRINTFEQDYTGNFLRLTSANWSMSFSLSDNNFRKAPSERESKEDTPNEILAIEEHNYYDYFNIPWSLKFDYSIRYSKTGIAEPNITQTVGMRGDLSITQKWKIGVQTGYDIQNKEISFTNINISRDLHCWHMTFRWIPFGTRKSYNFEIGVKASILSDLKYTKRESWLDNL